MYTRASFQREELSGWIAAVTDVQCIPWLPGLKLNLWTLRTYAHAVPVGSLWQLLLLFLFIFFFTFGEKPTFARRLFRSFSAAIQRVEVSESNRNSECGFTKRAGLLFGEVISDFT